MEQKMYSVRDKKTETYNTPWMKITHGDAERDFHQLVNDPKSKVNMFPHDYDLYHIGNFDTKSGTFSKMDSPVHLCQAVTFHKGQEEIARQNQTVKPEEC